MRDASRDIKLFRGIESIVRDVAFAARLAAEQDVTAAALVSLSLAIGGTAAFSSHRRPHPADIAGLSSALAGLSRLRTPAEPRRAQFHYPLFRELRAAAAGPIRLAISDESRRDAAFDEQRAGRKVYGQWVR